MTATEPITLIGHVFWSNDVDQIAETAKAVQLQVVGNKRFVESVGRTAWFPRSGLTVADGVASLKPWLRAKLTRDQEIVVGMR